jgi:alkanesulfonate monooxygenase SsuD/methylene tetrahydromethanopterin reductase-like flavin-dependent oxidoreductase (luciferase family)
MALDIALMVEGQEGLDWPRWQRLATAAEQSGFAGLYRSDHLTGLFGDADRGSLDTWASLACLATATKRIRFGPLVCPLTFYQPAILAKRAAAIHMLSGGRLDLGIGAGWHEPEHRMFGIPFPSLRERMDRFECGARAIRALVTGRPVTLDQPYYPLRGAQTHPVPRGGVPLIIGSRSERRGLRIVAEHADEWNATRLTFEQYRARCDALAEHCRTVGRDPGTIRRSLMVPVIIGSSSTELDARRRRAAEIFPRMPADAEGWRAMGFLHGSPGDVAQDLARWEVLGVSRVMLQILDMDDLDAIDAIAREVLPARPRTSG